MFATDRTGQMFKRYRVLRLLSRSNFADVYLAQHSDLKTQVVLKVFQTPLSPQEQDLFIAQARTIAGLTHSNIVQMLDFDVEEGLCFLVMAYVPDETLHQRYPTGSRLSVSHVVPFVKQLAAALSCAHGRNVIHQDIKPENMFLKRNGKVVLTDFAIPVIFSHTFAQRRAEGYIAPEQLRGVGSPASDQYALASVVYEWLTGQHLATVETQNQSMDAQPASLREKLSTLPPLVTDVIQTALKSDPQQRFKSIVAFANAFEQACAESQGLSVVPAIPDYATKTHFLHTQEAPLLEQRYKSVPSVPRTHTALESPASPGQAERKLQGKRGRRMLVLVLLALLLGVLAGGLFLAIHNRDKQASNIGVGHQRQATPVSTPTFTPTSTPLPTPTPTRIVGVVYQADWSKGWSGKGSRDWRVANNELVNDGSSYSESPDPTILAPYTMAATRDYAVETRVHVIAGWPCFDVALRGTSAPDGWHGYKAAVCDQKIRLQANNDILTMVPFKPGTIWHTYRIEVKGAHLRFFVDGQPLAETNNTRYSAGGQVGLKSYGTYLEISNFKVIAL